jgi:hypothetical protein
MGPATTRRPPRRMMKAAPIPASHQPIAVLVEPSKDFRALEHAAALSVATGSMLIILVPQPHLLRGPIRLAGHDPDELAHYAHFQPSLWIPPRRRGPAAAGPQRHRNVDALNRSTVFSGNPCSATVRGLALQEVARASDIGLRGHPVEKSNAAHRRRV